MKISSASTSSKICSIVNYMTKEDLLCLSSTWTCDFDDFWSFSTLEAEFNNENYISFVAKKESEIIGIANLWKSIDDIHITNIVIKKTYRGMGFGKVLLEELIKTSKMLNYSSLTLEVNENNMVAINLYKKFGFKELGIRKKYYNNKENAIIMTLFLKK